MREFTPVLAKAGAIEITELHPRRKIVGRTDTDNNSGMHFLKTPVRTLL